MVKRRKINYDKHLIEFLIKCNICIRFFRYVRKHNKNLSKLKFSQILARTDPYDFFILINWNRTKEGRLFWGKACTKWRRMYKGLK